MGLWCFALTLAILAVLGLGALLVLILLSVLLVHLSSLPCLRSSRFHSITGNGSFMPYPLV